MFFWGHTPDFFSLYPDQETDRPLDEDESLEDTLRNPTGPPIAWTGEDLHRVREDTAIPSSHQPPRAHPRGRFLPFKGRRHGEH